MRRQRVRHTTTFEERLAAGARQFKEAAEKEPPGSTARELLLRRARQAETASRLNDWLTSPGSHVPNMIGYRAYIIDEDGHIRRRVDILCEDDDTAKEEAIKLVDGHDVELWQLNRRICELRAKK
jgi:hypothetical protein